ncbi:MAG: hypothetical protein LBT98_00855 [Puniceicoccales bacterium]|jgi:hypothetical protein|nr:hypothetical protein [Puniceicoccales bacterium]
MPEFTESRPEQPAREESARSPRRRRNPIVANARKAAGSQGASPAIGPCDGATILPFQGERPERERKEYSTALAEPEEKRRTGQGQRSQIRRRHGQDQAVQRQEIQRRPLPEAKKCAGCSLLKKLLRMLWPFGKKPAARTDGEGNGRRRRGGHRNFHRQ